MKTESEIRAEYANQLEAILELDYSYYANKMPSHADRIEYAKRQARLGELREAFYVELSAIKQHRSSRAEVFEVKFEDRIMGNQVVSAPQCLLAHDLMNYVGIISGFCQLLAENTSEEPAQQKYVAAMLEAVRKITSCLRDRDCAARDHLK